MTERKSDEQNVHNGPLTFLDEGFQRSAQPGRGRYPDCRDRWPQGDCRGAGGGVSGHDAADLHRAPDRNSLEYASWKERRELAAALKPIYTAIDAQAAEAELTAFEQGPWGERYPTVAQAWRRAWDRVVPFFAFAPQVRKLIYTTNAIESLHSQLRKIIRTRGHFPSDEAATKLMWLALRNIMVDSGRSVREWRQAMNQFAIAFGDRFTRYVV